MPGPHYCRPPGLFYVFQEICLKVTSFLNLTASRLFQASDICTCDGIRFLEIN